MAPPYEKEERVMVEERQFDIVFRYKVVIDEAMFTGIGQPPDAIRYLLARKIADNLTDLSERERLPQLLTGYEIEDCTLLVDTQSDAEYLLESIGEAITATLTHVHVRPVEVKSRHHKRRK